MKRLKDRLYHYTSAVPFESILKHGCLHATHFRFLNDPNELYHVRDNIRKLFTSTYLSISKELDSNPDLNLLQRKSDEIAEIVITAFERHATTFLISFSQHESDFTKKNGLLSQWRNYGHDGGYAIGFSTHGFSQMLEDEFHEFKYLSNFLHPLDYGTPKPTEELIDMTRSVVSKYNDGIINLDVEGAFEKLTKIIYEICHAYKSKAFEDEHEVRAVFGRWDVADTSDDLDDQDLKPLEFKVRQGAIVPFIEIKGPSKKLPISEVLVGPHPNQDRRLQSTRLFLNSLGYEEIPVRKSSIAYTSFF